MMIRSLALVALLFAAPAHAQVHVSPFTFQIPPGWLNLSPGAPPENFRGLPPQVVEQARGVPFLAMDVAGGADGFAENVNLVLVGCPAGGYSQKTMEALARHPELKQQGMTIREASTLQVGGLTAGRLLTEMSSGGVRVWQAQYHLPGGTRCAILTYSSTPEAFARYLPTFEAAARATTGLATPPGGFLSRIGSGALRGALIGGVAGAIATLLFALFRKKKKA